ncbi:hypothetical protein nbrc107697_12200 [Gordonia crocea]|uniref:Uncharacterized protein n=2 Tax=Gordonia crocea TaxID=589162 RepID=A0A7I9UWL8_9ACTN|nr:hypothetical protein nbrc107697_12200 [Gordonia crocea]
MSPTMTVVATNLTMFLAAPDDTKGPEFGKASPIGLLVILVLLAGTALLIRSMNTQLRRLPETFDTEHPEADQAFDEGTDKVSIPVDAPDADAPDDTASP